MTAMKNTDVWKISVSIFSSNIEPYSVAFLPIQPEDIITDNAKKAKEPYDKIKNVLWLRDTFWHITAFALSKSHSSAEWHMFSSRRKRDAFLRCLSEWSVN